MAQVLVTQVLTQERVIPMQDQDGQRLLSIEQMPVALALLDRQRCFTACNHRWRQVLELPDGDLRGRTFGSVFPEMANIWEPRHVQALRGEVVTLEREPWRLRDGRTIWLRWEICPWSAQGQLSGLMMRVDAIRQRRGNDEIQAEFDAAPAGLASQATAELESTIRQLQLSLRNSLRQCRHLRQQAVRDPLTGLFNRRFLDAVLLRELARRTCGESRPTGLIMVDVDQFKQLNDHYGHLAGDAVLRQAARIIRSTLRRTDLACRFGGDEFALILPATDLASTWLAAETLHRRLAGLAGHISEWKLPRIRFSFGIAPLARFCAGSGHPLRTVDQALYQAKRAGGDQICALDHQDGARASEQQH